MAKETQKEREKRVRQILATRIKSLREAAELKQSELAKMAGIRSSTLSEIESGDNMPKLPTLMAIGEALGLPQPLSLMLRTDAKRKKLVVFDESQLEPYDLGDGFTYEVPDEVVRSERLLVSFVTMESGTTSEEMSHHGEELFYVLKGSVYVSVDGEESEVKQGWIAHYQSKTTHIVENRSRRAAKLLVVRWPAH